MWGSFSWAGMGPLVVLDGNVTGESYKSLIETHVYPTVLAMFDDDLENYYFQNDNAPPYRSAVALNMIQMLGIRHIQWPALSPDLNPVEDIWNYIKRRIYRLLIARQQHPTRALLQQIIVEEWDRLSHHPEIYQRFISRMHHRVKEVIRMRGYPTKF